MLLQMLQVLRIETEFNIHTAGIYSAQLTNQPEQSTYLTKSFSLNLCSFLTVTARNGEQEAKSPQKDIIICNPVAPAAPNITRPTQGETVVHGLVPFDYAIRWTAGSEGILCASFGCLKSFRKKLQ